MLSSVVDGDRVALKFYDQTIDDIVVWHDNTNYKPYCFSKLDKETLKTVFEGRNDIISIEPFEKKDLISDQPIIINKITCSDPLTINGTSSYKTIRNFLETWESDIKFNESYLYDYGLVCGKFYVIENDKIIPYNYDVNLNIPDTSNSMVNKEEFKNYVKEWAQLLNQPVPNLKRLSIDIEVESVGNLPDANLAEQKITAVGMAGSDGIKIVTVLRRKGVESGDITKIDKDVRVVLFDDDKEKQMIEFVFQVMEKYPIIITFNGDQFDFPYLYNRACKLNVDVSLFEKLKNSVTFKKGIHLDLFRIFSNRAYQIYTFNNKYSDYSLNTISSALLGEEKIKNDNEFAVIPDFDLAHYCFNDARLALKLTTFNNNLLMKILVMTARIAKSPIDTISRYRVSNWVKSMLYFEHRKKNALIPRRIELDMRTVKPKEESIIDGKKFKGALVLEPKKGIHFNITTLDFASLYPSIVKTWNVSYETIRCVHEECKNNKIPLTDHWSCTKKNGVLSMAIGSLRDLRINYYKSLVKNSNGEEKEMYEIISQTLKVYLNASYGIMGFSDFPLFYLPAAETVTAVGRESILSTIDECKKLGADVIYGDTDSVFVKNMTQEKIKTIINSIRESKNIDIEVDKEYRYLVLSDRKKNYFGIKKDGSFDIKGLTIKKSHSAPFVKKLFDEIKEDLIQVMSISDFENTKKKIQEKMTVCYNKLFQREIPLEDLTFHLVLSKNISEYTQNTPQHIKAALQTMHEFKKGDVISFVKVLGKKGVKPAEQAKITEIDVEKYVEFMKHTMIQIIEPLNITFEEAVGLGKQVSIDQFF